MYSKASKAQAALRAKALQAASNSIPTLALQLNSGERLIHDFAPETSMWDVLDHWNSAGKLIPPLQPECDEVPVCIYLRKEISSADNLKKTTLQQLGITSGKVAIRYMTRAADAPREQAHVGGVLAPTARPPTPEKDPIPVAQAVTTSVEALSSTHPSEDKFTPMEVDAPASDCPIEPEATPVTATEKAEERVAQKADIENRENVPVNAEQFEIAAPVFPLNDRGDLIYSMNDLLTSEHKGSTKDDIPDEFFELSVDELKRRMRELQQACASYQEAPLLTSELRQAQKEQRDRQLLERYPVTVLRIQFSDRMVLQLALPSQTLISLVKEHVKAYLDDPPHCDVQGDFDLFTSPPKAVLETNRSLFECGLTPSAVVYISSSKTGEDWCKIKGNYRQNLSSHLGAMQDASKRLVPSHLPPVDQTVANQSSTPSTLSSTAPSAKRSTSNAASNKTKSAPKWFKMGH